MILRLILIFHFTCCHCQLLDTTAFEEKINTISNYDMGVEHMQNLVNTDVVFTEESMDGNSLGLVLANAVRNKFGSRIELVRHLQDRVEQTFRSFTATSSYQECCHISRPPEFNPRFRDYVNFETMCLRKSEYASADLVYATEGLFEQFRANMETVPGLKYQYFGSEQGVLFSYPALSCEDCSNYDPRFRPWYVNTATPVAKDVVLVIDVSGSMAISPENMWDSRMDMAKQAAKTVIGTLNPKDRIGVVSFSTNAHAASGVGDTGNCFHTRLAPASYLTKTIMSSFVDGFIPQGETYYSRGLNKAFDLFRNSQSHPTNENRKKVILFLTDGNPSPSDINYIISTIETNEAQLDNSVSILAFGIGGVQQSGEQILNQMVTTSQNEPGFVTMLTDITELRREMASYYNFFASPEINDPIISSPYFDFFGLGLITTVSLPVYNNNQLVGVVGIDMSLGDLFDSVGYFVQDAYTYVFVTNSDGIVMTHPLIPQPSTVDDAPVFTHISLLEQAPDMQPLLADMAAGGEGSGVVTNTITLSKGVAATEGVRTESYEATFYYYQINGTGLSLGLMVGSTSVARTAALDTSMSNVPFIYHLHDLMYEPPATCKHFLRAVVAGDSVVKFGPSAFLEPFTYLEEEETTNTVQLYENIINRATADTMFQPGVREGVSISALIHPSWFGETTVGSYYVWRYLALNNGILRLTPGTKLDKHYDPLTRNWYKRSVAFTGTNVFSAPYLDAFGAGYVVTLSRTITSGSSGRNDSLEDIMGVMAVDFTTDYLYYALKTTFPPCAADQYSCFIMDSAGYIVVHPDFIFVVGHESPLVANVHVTVKEPVIGEDLINRGVMVRRSCVDAYRVWRQFQYEMVLPAGSLVSDMPFYEVHHVPGTNVYVVLYTHATTSPDCSCTDERATEPPLCEQRADHVACPCPCHQRAQYDFCEGRFLLNDTSTSWDVCPPVAPGVEVIMTTVEVTGQLAGLDECFHVVCGEYTDDSCFIRPQCNYCVKDENGRDLEAPFCAAAEYCYFGQIGFRSPYSVIETVDDNWTIVVIVLVLAVVVGGTLASIGILCYIKKRAASHRNSMQNPTSTQLQSQQQGYPKQQMGGAPPPPPGYVTAGAMPPGSPPMQPATYPGYTGYQQPSPGGFMGVGSY